MFSLGSVFDPIAQRPATVQARRLGLHYVWAFPPVARKLPALLRLIVPPLSALPHLIVNFLNLPRPRVHRVQMPPHRLV